MNIIVVQTSKLIFVRSKIAAPLNFVALFGRTPRTCLRPALHMPANLQTPAYTTAFDAQLVLIPFYSQSLLIDICELLCFNHG